MFSVPDNLGADQTKERAIMALQIFCGFAAALFAAIYIYDTVRKLRKNKKQ